MSDLELKEIPIIVENGAAERQSLKEEAKKARNLNGSFTFYLMLSTTFAVFGAAFQQGYQIGLFNTPEAVIKDFYKSVYKERNEKEITDNQLTTLWSLSSGFFPLGGILGALVSGIVADKFGRKRGMLIVNFIVFITILVNSSSKYLKSYESILAGRFLGGVYSGLFTGVLPLYLNETSPMNMRGIIGTINQAVVVTGILSANILGLPELLGTEELWPVLIGFILVPALSNCCLVFFEESPKYLYKTDKEAAEKALKKFRGSKNKELIKDELDSYKDEQLEILSQKEVSWSDLWKLNYLRRPLIASIVIQMSQQFSGINAVMLFSTLIFTSAGFDEKKATYCSILLNVVNLLMTFVSLGLIERAGRRILLLIGLIGMCLSSVGLATFLTLIKAYEGSLFANLAIVCAVLFVGSLAIGPGGIPWLITSELFDSSARGKATSIAGFVNWTCNSLVCFLFPFLNAAIGSYSFYVFGVLLAFFSLFVLIFVPETRDRSAEEIKELFKERVTFFDKKYF